MFDRCFYNSRVDKKVVQGLLVKGSYKQKIIKFMFGQRRLNDYPHRCGNSAKSKSVKSKSPQHKNRVSVTGALHVTQQSPDKVKWREQSLNNSDSETSETGAGDADSKAGTKANALDNDHVDKEVHTYGGDTMQAPVIKPGRLHNSQNNKSVLDTVDYQVDDVPGDSRFEHSGIVENNANSGDEYCLLYSRMVVMVTSLSSVHYL